jgi:hypothetical protein
MPLGRARKSQRAERGTRSQQFEKTRRSTATLEVEAGNQAINELIDGARRRR